MHGKDKLLHLSSNSSRHDILLTDELNRAQDDKTQTNKGKKNKNKKIKKKNNNNNNKMTSKTEYLLLLFYFNKKNRQITITAMFLNVQWWIQGGALGTRLTLF